MDSQTTRTTSCIKTLQPAILLRKEVMRLMGRTLSQERAELETRRIPQFMIAWLQVVQVLVIHLVLGALVWAMQGLRLATAGIKLGCLNDVML